MYGFFFSLKKDGRKLLLDYSKIENPLIKDFPSEGFNNVFYNFFFNQVTTIKNEVVEL
jgi:NADH:ubiquinone oxidoreductase subunit C